MSKDQTIIDNSPAVRETWDELAKVSVRIAANRQYQRRLALDLIAAGCTFRGVGQIAQVSASTVISWVRGKQ